MNPTTLRILILVLTQVTLSSCKNVPLAQPGNTPAAAMPATLGCIPSHRH